MEELEQKIVKQFCRGTVDDDIWMKLGWESKERIGNFTELCKSLRIAEAKKLSKKLRQQHQAKKKASQQQLKSQAVTIDSGSKVSDKLNKIDSDGLSKKDQTILERLQTKIDHMKQEHIKFFESCKTTKMASVPSVHDKVEISSVENSEAMIQQRLSRLKQQKNDSRY